jgi:hypothetical protein
MNEFTNIEIWKNVAFEGYEHYQISNYSNVKNKYGKILKPASNQYIFLHKHKNIKLYKAIYEISLVTFKGNKPDNNIRYTVDHIDRNHHNNYIDNLRWASPNIQNTNKNPVIEINRNPFIYIKNNEEKIFSNLKLVANEFKIHVETLRSRLKNKDFIKLDNGILKKNNLIPSNIKEIPDWIYKDGFIPKKKYYASSNGLILIPISKIWSKGTITSKNRPELKQYYKIGIANKNYRIHTLIAATFLNKPPIDDKGNKYIVNHIDNNGLNNDLNNLEYLSNSQNCQHAINFGVSDKRKPILCYALNGKFIKEYLSIKDAEEELDIKSSDIGKVCNKNNTTHFTCYGYQWLYKTKDPILLQIDPYINSVKKIVCKYDLNGNFIKNYLSITEASKDTNIGDSAISSSCKNKNRQAGNYLWRLFLDNNVINNIEPYINKNIKSVTQYDLNGKFIKTYKSLKEATDDLNIYSSAISNACKKNTKCYKSLWRYGNSQISLNL